MDKKLGTAPDWLYWHAQYQATPEECICLSFGVEPCPTDGIAFEPLPEPAKSPTEVRPEGLAAPVVVGGFDDEQWRVQQRHYLRAKEAISTLNSLAPEARVRHQMLQKHLRAKHVTLRPLTDEWGAVRIGLLDFARWANMAGWTLPNELTLDDLRPSAATDNETEPATKAKQAAIGTKQNLDRTTQSRSTASQDRPTWQQSAQDIAKNFIKDCKAKDLYPNQITIADHVATSLRKAGIFGADGKPLSGAYIKRHTLKGISSAKDKQSSTTTIRGK